MRTKFGRNRPRGFTKVEFAIVLVVLALVAGLLVGGGLHRARRMARTSKCANNLKQLGMGIVMYGAEFCISPPALLCARMGSELRDRDEQEGGFRLYGRTYLLGFLNKAAALAEAGDDDALAAYRQQWIEHSMRYHLTVAIGIMFSSPGELFKPAVGRCPEDPDWSSNFAHPFQPDDGDCTGRWNNDVDGIYSLLASQGMEFSPEVFLQLESSYMYASGAYHGCMAGDVSGGVISDEAADDAAKLGWSEVYERCVAGRYRDEVNTKQGVEPFYVSPMPWGKQGANVSMKPFDARLEAPPFATLRGKRRVPIKEPKRKVRTTDFSTPISVPGTNGNPDYRNTRPWHYGKRSNVLFHDGHVETVKGGWWKKYPPTAGPASFPIEPKGDASKAYLPCHWKDFRTYDEKDTDAENERRFSDYACYD